MTDQVRVDGGSLTCRRLAAVARHGAPFDVPADARERVERSHALADETVAVRPVYGRTTGVGANRSEAVDASDTAHGVRLLASHAAATGPELSDEVAMATMLVRLNQLAAGGAGLSPVMFGALDDSVRRRVIPTIHRGGSIGTGDIAGLAELGLMLCGRAPARSGTPRPVSLTTGDALAFISSSAMTLADSAFCLLELDRLLAATEAVNALSFCATLGSWESLATEVHEARPYPAAARCAREMRELLGLRDRQTAPAAARLQDPFGWRTFTVVHGCAHDAAAGLQQVVETDINAATENPLVCLSARDVFHNGNFHLAPLALAVQYAASALFGTAKLSAARLSDLMEPAQTGLPSFLAPGPPGSSGLMILEYVVQDALAQMRPALTSFAASSVVVSQGLEDDSSFAPQAVQALWRALDPYRTILSCELVAAARALQLRGGLPTAAPVGDVFAHVAKLLPSELADRPLGGDVDVARGLLDELPGIAGLQTPTP
ncbi:MAG TPA: aromatic amino acid lyase [Nocardioidaceae bacterium]|nr:aromatic amino acid lyase [Nocardioidaceae bacterium]